MDANQRKRNQRVRRHKRVRKKVSGTREHPRMGVFRSLKHIYGLLVDDEDDRVLLAVSSLTPEIKSAHPNGGNVAAAAAVGELLGRRAKDRDITRAVFDRSGYRYHGRVKALAEAARKAGMEF